MDWIHSYASLRSHPKTTRLARNLGVTVNEAIGILHSLWWWSVDYAPDGDLTDIDADVIATACGWDGDAEELIAALVKATVRKGGHGFLENGDGLHIHDHYEYIGRHIEAAAADAERKRDERRKESVQRTSDGRRSDGARTADVDRKIDRKKELTADVVDKPGDNSGRRRARSSSTPPGAAKRSGKKSEPTPISEYLAGRTGRRT